MKSLALLTATTLLLSLSVLALAPPATAVGTCSELKDSWCDDYLLCVGYTRDSRGFQCQRGVRNPFDPCTCPPIMSTVLP